MPNRLLGITVLGDFLLSEGVDAVLDNVCRVGATAVACNPTVTAAAAEGEGSFQPPIDAGSSPRTFDRPLFGQHALWVRSGVAYEPRAELYADCPYGPRKTNDLTAAHGHVIGEFVDRARDRGLEVYFQIGAAQPTGLRDEDRPRLPDGSLPAGRMADTASPASPAVRAYNRAYVRDLFAEYPNLTGIRVDWPEYPCYTLGEVFQGFEPHVETWCAEREFDFGYARNEAGAMWNWLHGRVTNSQLDVLESFESGPFGRELRRIRSALSADLLRDWREAITDAAGPDRELSANAFMTPYSVLTGFEDSFAEGTDRLPGLAHCESFAPKLYTMHWSQMIDFWARELLAANPGLDDEPGLVRLLVGLTDIDEPNSPRTHLSDWGYPAPDEPHPVPDEPQRRKLAAMKACTPADKRMHALVHGYGPPTDFERRLRLVAESDADGCWINRYGYLGDAKLDAIARVWK